MSDFSSFWATKHEQLKDGCVDESGLYAEHCGALAMDIAHRLQTEGRSPKILTLTGIKVDGVNTKTLIPLAYEGKVTWGGHTVCVADGLAYDPILEEPEPWETYPQKVFGEPVLTKDASYLVEVK